MALTLRLLGQRCLLRRPFALVSASTTHFPGWTPMTTLAEKSGEDFWDKNKRLNRPLSPHLGIYKWEITMAMSITHRITGLAMATGIYTFSIGMLALPASFPYYANLIQSLHLGSGVLYAAKFLIAFPFIFHVCSGLRHIAWDLGKGFEIKTLYITGYAAAATAVLTSAVVAAL